MHAALKSLVIGLGVLIALGLGLLVYGFFKTSQDPTWRLFGDAKPAAATAGTPPPAHLAPPLAVSGDIELNLPTGCEIKSVTQLGGQIYILTQPAGVCGQVLIVDPAAGRVTGRINP
ncbi:MAG TPA: hypothetical protein DIW51_04805 [Rhodospirillaceae bacterium]|jgi:hypothetical protein|nr:hypothetical protein [Magnetovibrio sp.]HBT44051.1 hypothetical protein [Rhodospirillaceae bacterium]HCS69271.1 hypothetical protein [Rhodospirillaceae bacterium]|tara:strand:- start:1500 stop:1850 length:351 start_codon:yes stop_codon:yes gene_type:complete